MEENYIPHSDSTSSFVSAYNTRAKNGSQSRNAAQYNEMNGSDSILSDSDSYQNDENYQNKCYDSDDSDDYDVADVLVQTMPIRTRSRLIQAEEKYIRTEIELQERYGKNVEPPKYVAPKPAVTIKVVAVSATPKFRCKCLVVFPTEEQLHEHIRTMHPVRDFKCIACPMSFDTSAALDAHVYNHIGVQPYRCKICQQGYSTLSNLTWHQRHPPYSCRKFTEAGSKEIRRTQRNQFSDLSVPRKKAKVNKSVKTEKNTTMYTVKEEPGSWVFQRCEPTNQMESSCPEEPATPFDNTRSVPTQTPETASKEVQVDIEESSSNFLVAPLPSTLPSDLHVNSMCYSISKKFLSITNYYEQLSSST